jgi:hypothetical protein
VDRSDLHAASLPGTGSLTRAGGDPSATRRDATVLHEARRPRFGLVHAANVHERGRGPRWWTFGVGLGAARDAPGRNRTFNLRIKSRPEVDQNRWLAGGSYTSARYEQVRSCGSGTRCGTRSVIPPWPSPRAPWLHPAREARGDLNARRARARAPRAALRGPQRAFQFWVPTGAETCRRMDM